MAASCCTSQVEFLDYIYWLSYLHENYKAKDYQPLLHGSHKMYPLRQLFSTFSDSQTTWQIFSRKEIQFPQPITIF